MAEPSKPSELSNRRQLFETTTRWCGSAKEHRKPCRVTTTDTASNGQKNHPQFAITAAGVITCRFSRSATVAKAATNCCDESADNDGKVVCGFRCSESVVPNELPTTAQPARQFRRQDQPDAFQPILPAQ